MLQVFFLAFFFQAAQPYDILILNGTVVDGSGGPWFRADVGIRAGRIAAIGKLGEAAATTRIDAKGRIVSPGFIDIHTHARRGIFEDSAAQNYIRQGVTTLIEGNDGSSPIPLAPFFSKLASTPIAVNFGSFAGQGSIRQQVTGLENRKATPTEIDRMKDIARQAMLDGALGMSTGLFYVPGNFTPTEEVVEIAKVFGAMGGMHISHMRDEAADITKSVAETIRIGEEGGLPTQVTHHKIIGAANWGKSTDTLRQVADARERGVDATIDMYPYTASSTGTAALFPQWSLAGGAKALNERLAAPEQHQKIKAAIVTNIIENRGGGDPKNIVMASCSFNPAYDGKSLAQITSESGRTPTAANAADTAIDIQGKGGCSAVYHAISEDDVMRVLRSPLSMIGSDGEIPQFGKGAPHPRSYGTFARVLSRYVRDRRTITLEDAVFKMAGFPAQRLKLFDRGLLRLGMRADVAVFDLGKVRDLATFEKPHQYATGFTDVIVNGKAVILDGKLTSERPGMVLYGPAKR